MGLQIGYIFYDPLTSIADMREDADFLLEIGEAYNLFNFVQSMDVYPGTPYRRMIQKKGLGHFEHAYRGGFRLYDYEDRRIGPLAAAVDQLYAPQLMAVDRTFMRLRAFNLPRLRWLDEGGYLGVTERGTYREVHEEAESLFFELARIHHGWKRHAIDLTEKGLDMSALEASFNAMLTERRSEVARLELLANAADQLASRVHAQVNQNVRARVIMAREDQLDRSAAR